MRPRRGAAPAALLAALSLAASPLAGAEMQLALYGGVQTVQRGGVSGSDPVLGGFAFETGWLGESVTAPPYWGARLTRWRGDGWGLALELNHAKAIAPEESQVAQGFGRLEFTDGLNLLTVNVMRRFAPAGRLEPYAGLGLGLAVPHVDVTTPAGRTYGYQVTGPAVVWVAGASVPLGRGTFRAFAEYKGSRSWNEADLEGGGRLEADITTHALNLGLLHRF